MSSHLHWYVDHYAQVLLINLQKFSANLCIDPLCCGLLWPACKVLCIELLWVIIWKHLEQSGQILVVGSLLKLMLFCNSVSLMYCCNFQTVVMLIFFQFCKTVFDVEVHSPLAFPYYGMKQQRNVAPHSSVQNSSLTDWVIERTSRMSQQRYCHIMISKRVSTEFLYF